MRAPSNDDVHASIASRLAVHEQRYTPSRRALIDELVHARRPLTIAEIIERKRTLPQSSVYRNLTVLEEAGAVRRVTGADEFSRFELTEDLTEHHHHLVCTDCGAVIDYALPARLERGIERVTEEIARSAGFKVDAHSLDFVGLCADCDKR
jgi:Fur family ferric uptake transcriptional regulator